MTDESLARINSIEKSILASAINTCFDNWNVYDNIKNDHTKNEAFYTKVSRIFF